MIGKTLGHYEITELLGKGGMGEVYRARDTKLGREVAIKVLPREMSGDPERIARFSREARTLASLQHANIASIYGFEEHAGTRFLVMELVGGEDLQQRIQRGRLDLAEVVEIARQMATGLEVAHEQGIVHRDLKPANVKLTPDGEVKILDFGLARAYVGDPASDPDLSNSPTITAALTGHGVILGTAAYMSPEQARGRTVDRRADIWAFGAILFEMLTGGRLFAGETVSDTLAFVLHRELPWDELPAGLPPRLVALLRRCLERDPKKRLRDIGEARIALESPDEPGPAAGTAPVRAWPWRGMAAIAVLGIVAISGSLYFANRRGHDPLPLRKFSIELRSTGARTLASFGPSISPDGSSVAYVDAGQLWVLDLASLEPRPLDGTEEAVNPFWSPDGKWLGYLKERGFYRVPHGGGTATKMATLPDRVGSMSGGSAGWSEDGRIAVGTTFTELLQFSDQGGEVATLLPNAPGDLDVHEVAALPDGRGWIMTVHREVGEGNLAALSASGERHDLLSVIDDTFSGVTYSPTGHVLFRRISVATGIWALPFSLDRMEATGEPFLVAEGGFNPSVARDGTLAYRRAEAAPLSEMVWLDREGKEIAVVAPTQTTMPFPSLSPDGKTVALCNGPEYDRDVWLFNTETGLERRVTFDRMTETSAVFSPDGKTIYYQDAVYALTAIDLESGVTRKVATAISAQVTPSGDTLVYGRVRLDPGLDIDLVRRPIDGGEEDEQVLVATKGLDWSGQVSPDERFIVYASTESGHEEIYLTTYPEPTQRWDISRGSGGGWPHWRGDGGEIFYTTDTAIMSVEVDLSGDPRIGRPRQLFERPTTRWSTSWRDGFDVSADGQRFILLRPKSDAPAPRIVVVQNWFAEFAK